MATRRSFLATAAAWWTQAAQAAHQHMGSAATGPYKLQYFTAKEVAILRAIAAVIIPAGEQSGGAAAVPIEEYIDFITAHGSAAMKDAWRKGLATYAGKSAAEITRMLTEASVGEFAPRSDKQKFFVMVKGAVVESFYTSEEGISKELGYQGMAFLVNFDGCTHASHTTPAGYQPLIGKELREKA